MTAWPLEQLMPAVLGGHSTEPYWVAIPIIGLALLARLRGVRGRGRGPRGRGPNQWGNAPSQEPPEQWDIRKPTPPPPPAAGDAGEPSEEHNPPSDL